MKFTPALEQNFWSKVDRSAGSDACWPWLRCKPNKRYGGFYIGSTYYAAHRIALELSGVSVPDNLNVLHSCDNAVCCNPKHLSLGNHQINMNQCILRDRKNAASGEKNGNRKLTEAQVREIKKLQTTLCPQEIATHFNVEKTTIHRILSKKTWKHVL